MPAVPSAPSAEPARTPTSAATAPAGPPARPASTGGAFQTTPATEIPDVPAGTKPGPAAEGGRAASGWTAAHPESTADDDDPDATGADHPGTDRPGAGPQDGPVTPAPAATATATPPAPAPGGDCAPAPGAAPDTSAATKFGWGTPSRVDNFDGPLDHSWGVYDGAGHNGAGRRTPDAITVDNGIMTMTGDAQGNSGGMAWQPGQRYGRWEGRVRSLTGDPDYHAVMLLWPDAENWPLGGEVDFMEISDPSRQNTQMFLHYGADNQQVQGDVDVDATQWHDWAVEWTPTGVTAYVDGRKWWSTTEVDILPPGAMHLCIQLDNFGGTSMKKTTMEVDWVKEYKLGATAGGAPDTADRSVDGATAPLTEGAPDPVPAVAGLVPDAVSAPRG